MKSSKSVVRITMVKDEPGCDGGGGGTLLLSFFGPRMTSGQASSRWIQGETIETANLRCFRLRSQINNSLPRNGVNSLKVHNVFPA